MYNIKLCDYVPEPKPATSDRIVAAHYYPSWKKGTAGLHNGFDDMHDYPERTPLCGYYDGASPVFCDWEIKWALEHGVNCFIYCWYRKKENLGKPVTVSDLRLGETLHNGFFKAKYSSMMKFAIMFETSKRWAAADEDDLINNLMPFWIKEYFSKDNYLKIDNKPVLFVFDFNDKQFRNSFNSLEAQKRAFERCRCIARENGFDGMIFASECHLTDFEQLEAEMAAERASGYDFNFPYCVHSEKNGANDEEIILSQLNQFNRKKEKYADFCIPTVSCMWDPRPRYDTMPDFFNRQSFPFLWKLLPENWCKLLKEMKNACDSLPDDAIGKKIIMLDNWNEWDEGHYLLPSVEFGFKYLQAIREEFTVCDNLPDYRMPQDIGSPTINVEWDEPNLKGIAPHLKNQDGSNNNIYD